MARDFGVVAEDSTLNVFFTTSLATGARSDLSSVLEDADIVFIKDGTVATITGALTHTLTFNSDTGVYKLAIDLSADADFTTGSDWTVYAHPDETVDAVTPAAIVCYFKIETLEEQAMRLYRTSLYALGCVIATTTGNTTGRILLSDVLDAQVADGDLVGSMWDVWDATNGQWNRVVVTTVQSARLFNVVLVADGSAMDFTVAAGDRVWFVGYNALRETTGTVVTWSATRGLAGTALPAAAADAAGGLPISDAGGLDLDAQIGTDLDAILVDTAEIGTAGAGLTNINLPNQTMDIVGNITGNLSGSVGSVTGLTNATIADAVLDEDMTAHQTQGTLGQAIGDPGADANTIFKAVVTDAAGATVGVDVVAVKAETAAILDDTDDIGVAGAGLTALATQASVNTIDDLLDSEMPALTTAVADLPTNAELATALGTADDAVLAAIAALDDLSSAQMTTAAELAIANAFGIVTGTLNDAAATVNGFTLTETVGTDIRLGVLRLTSGALAGESRMVTWTGTTVAVVKPTSVPAGLTTIGPFSAAPANGVTYTFRPL